MKINLIWLLLLPLVLSCLDLNGYHTSSDCPNLNLNNLSNALLIGLWSNKSIGKVINFENDSQYNSAKKDNFGTVFEKGNYKLEYNQEIIFYIKNKYEIKLSDSLKFDSIPFVIKLNEHYTQYFTISTDTLRRYEVGPNYGDCPEIHMQENYIKGTN